MTDETTTARLPVKPSTQQRLKNHLRRLAVERGEDVSYDQIINEFLDATNPRRKK